ncbi:cell division protein FtsQ/DivIB [Bacterioplanoides pacificum]|uniref:Cell division protein FtsQ/DivIB n=1 Tax=Bacterioplanoides pacificum TaxID=1171596 RepID=A0ABV7VV04_9GAMM
MAKKGNLSGATPLVEKPVRQWRLPRIPLYWLMLPLVIAGLFFSVRWVYQSWPINSVEVTGQFSLWQPQQIAQQIAWLKQESFFSADLQQVYDQINDLPLLKVVKVKKQWPGTVWLQVHEDIPLAIWNGDELLTLGGEMLPRPGFVRGDNLARMRGNTQYSESAMRNYRRLHQMLQGSDVSVVELEVSDVGSIRVLLSNQWSVNFGRHYFEERMRRLGLLLRTLPQEQVAGIDLRYGKGAAINWHPPGEMES